MGGIPGLKKPIPLIDFGDLHADKRKRHLRHDKLKLLNDRLGSLSFSLLKGLKVHSSCVYDQKSAPGLRLTSLFMSGTGAVRSVLFPDFCLWYNKIEQEGI